MGAGCQKRLDLVELRFVAAMSQTLRQNSLIYSIIQTNGHNTGLLHQHISNFIARLGLLAGIWTCLNGHYCVSEARLLHRKPTCTQRTHSRMTNEFNAPAAKSSALI